MYGRTSSFRAECEAFSDALHWLKNNAIEGETFLVLTDSLSLVTKLEAGKERRSGNLSWIISVRTSKQLTFQATQAS